MSAFAITLCVLASVSFGAVATITVLKTVFNAGFDDRRTCDHCAVAVARCLVERDAPPTRIVCGHCFHYGPPRAWPDDIDAEFEPSPETDKGATSQAISGAVVPAGPKRPPAT